MPHSMHYSGLLSGRGFFGYVMLYVYPLHCSCCHCDGISYLRINCLQFPVFLSSSAENWAQRLCVNLATKRVGSILAEAVAQKTNLNAGLLWPLWLRTGLLSSCTKFQCLYVNLFCLFAHTQCANHHKAEMTLAEFIRHAWMLLTAKHYWHVPIHDWQSGPLAVLHGCLMWQCSTHGTDVTLSACRRSLGNFRSLLFFHVIIKIRWLRSQ